MYFKGGKKHFTPSDFWEEAHKFEKDNGINGKYIWDGKVVTRWNF